MRKLTIEACPRKARPGLNRSAWWGELEGFLQTSWSHRDNQDDPKFRHAVLAVMGAYVLLFMNPKMKNNSWDQIEVSSVEKESNLFKTFHFP